MTKEQLAKDRKESEAMRKTVLNVAYAHECDKPKPEDIRYALDNRQVLWRFKNNHVQVLAQTLSNCMGTRTSSLLAVNKKQGVPSKYIHREWKVTWVDLEGLKKRVEHTEHGSLLLDNLKQVIQALDGRKPVGAHPPVEKPANALKRRTEGKQTKQNPIDVCEVAVEANKRAVHNTERINDLSQKMHNHEKGAERTALNLSADTHNVSIRVDDLEAKSRTLEDGVRTVRGKVDTWFPSFFSRFNRLETSMYGKPVTEGIDPGFLLKNDLNFIKERLDRVDKQATQATVDQTLLGDLNTRLGRLATQADRLDTKTDGLVSRVSVLEDTSKWLSWTLAGVVGIRFLGLMLRLLRRK